MQPVRHKRNSWLIIRLRPTHFHKFGIGANQPMRFGYHTCDHTCVPRSRTTILHRIRAQLSRNLPAHRNDTHSTPIIRARIYPPNDDAFSHSSSVKLPPLATALFNSLPIFRHDRSIHIYIRPRLFSGTSHPYTYIQAPRPFPAQVASTLLHTAPRQISQPPDLRSGDSRYRHSL